MMIPAVHAPVIVAAKRTAIGIAGHGFADVTAKFYGEVDIPVCTTNRINTPEKGEEILAFY